MPDILNPTLYLRLKQHFKRVHVSNDGQKFIGKAVKQAGGGYLLDTVQDGEFYSINCPYCKDTRKRLYVNHMFGRRDNVGRRMTFLAICFNEGCLYNRTNQQDFVETLEETPLELAECKVREGVELPEEARVVQWPGPCRRLDELPKQHEARLYLRERGFDPDLLARKFTVAYCTDSHYFLARNRIIIPVFEAGELKGWQARYVGDLDWKGPKKKDLPPKYFSCPGSQFRSRCVFNFDEMSRWRWGVIEEGPTDVFRFGSMSGCIFGNSVTSVQKKKLLDVFKDRGRGLICLLDPEERESKTTPKMVAEFKRLLPGQFADVWLPDGTDPGSLDREFLKEYVREQAADQGVKVIYKRV